MGSRLKLWIMVSVIRPNGLGSLSAMKWVLYEPVRVRWLAGMIDHRPARCKGGVFEIESDLLAAKGPTSWIFEEVISVFDTEYVLKILGGRKRQIEKFN